MQKINPHARVVIVGHQTGVSYGKAAICGSWKDVFMSEIEGKVDLNRIIFTGPLLYHDFLKILRISSAHVYLTYPFVLSWSVLEAMSSEAPIVGSATAPVQEVIEDRNNGLLVDFFSPTEIAEAINELLTNRALSSSLGKEARKTVVTRYSLEVCLPRQLALIDLVASRALMTS